MIALDDCSKIGNIGYIVEPHWFSRQHIGNTKSNIGNIQPAILDARLLDVFKSHFDPWPLLPPETLDQIQQANTLFRLLINRPQAPAELPVEALCLQVNADMTAAAMAESRDIQLFRERNSERIAFRDLDYGSGGRNLEFEL